MRKETPLAQEFTRSHACLAPRAGRTPGADAGLSASPAAAHGGRGLPEPRQALSDRTGRGGSATAPANPAALLGFAEVSGRRC